jgi:hypothetical protein
MNDIPTERDEVEMLLPWYATGRLDAADKIRVEALLARDSSLARQLELIEEERRGTVQANEHVTLPAALSIRDSMKRIVSKHGAGNGQFSGIASRIRAFFESPEPNAVRWAMAAAVALILLQTAWIGAFIAAREPAGYVTAAGGAAQPSNGTFVLVRFAETTTVKDMTAALAKLGMTLTDGPKAGALYRVRIGEFGITNDKRDARIADLKGIPGLVVLVTPTQ